MARILIADDQPHLLRVLRLRLEHAGHEVISAEDGESALTKAIAERPDLAILDVSMPRLDGLSVAERLRETANTDTMPVVFVTARSSHADQQRAESVGAFGYLVKPFEADELLRMVADAIESLG